MADQLYPIGIQTFSEIIEGGYKYVDKTQFVGKLIKEGKYVFLSRPRRFGKSLLLSTLHTYFEGRRDLFKGLAIDSMDMDWTPMPMLHFDFNSGLFKQQGGLLNRITKHLADFEHQFGLEPRTDLDVALRFESLIQEVHEKTGKQVVILVDEYDKPLLELEEDSELYESNQRLLKALFSNLKSMDAYIKFGMLSGVARFSKVSIFSDLNNLEDISMLNDYSDICGWTEKELKDYFSNGIYALAAERDEDFDTTLDAENLLPLYAPATSRSDSPFRVQNFEDDIYDGHPEAFMKRLETLIKSLPYKDQDESTYRAVTFLLCLLSGTEANPERHSYKGRSDLEVLTPDYIYVFEFKYNKSVQEALDQIRDRDYAGRYALDSRKVFLIAANFIQNKETRGLEYRIVEK